MAFNSEKNQEYGIKKKYNDVEFFKTPKKNKA